MSNKMAYKLQATRDYRIFELAEFNRDVTNIKKLKQSMQRHGYIPAYPLHVMRKPSGHLAVKAGHHRLEAAMSLKIAVFYIICEDQATIYELEAATDCWSLADYMVSFCRCAFRDYVAIRDYINATGISLSHAIAMHGGHCAGSGNFGPQWKSGTYKIKDTDHPRQVAQIIALCDAAGMECARHVHFVAAISQMLRVPAFDVRQFLTRVDANAALGKRQPGVQAYRELIETIYNRNSHKKLPLAFMCADASRQRRSNLIQSPTTVGT